MSDPKESAPLSQPGIAKTLGWKPIVAGAALLIAAGVVYASLGDKGNGLSGPSPAAQCAASAAVSARIAPFAKGEVAAVAMRKTPEALPNLAFKRPDGAPVTLADFKGRTVLLNLWATWCAPCKKEMPALNQLQAELGGKDFEVVAVNIDTRNAERAPQFLDDIGVKNLTRYTDQSVKIFDMLKANGKAFGMPTTILIDANGCELGNLAGPAEWAGADAIAFVKAALQR
ncbi:MAG: thiol:disulfide interchange protein TlpA [Beijerinckiaceae bacterium]